MKLRLSKNLAALSHSSTFQLISVQSVYLLKFSTCMQCNRLPLEKYPKVASQNWSH